MFSFKFTIYRNYNLLNIKIIRFYFKLYIEYLYSTDDNNMNIDFKYNY